MSSLGFNFGGAQGGGGDITPFVKYDARAGRIRRVDRVQGPSGWESREEDITRIFKACFDLANLEVGWINYQAGGPPSFVLVRAGEPFPPKPGDKGWKQGARVLLQLGRDCGGDVRELTSNAEAFLRGLEPLYDEYRAKTSLGGFSDGELPVVILVDAKAVQSAANAQGQSSTNYVPIFRIEGWTPRPPKLVWTPKGDGARMEAGSPPGGSGYTDQGRSSSPPADQRRPPSGPPAGSGPMGFGTRDNPVGAGAVLTRTRGEFTQGNGGTPYTPPAMNRPPATGSTIAVPPGTVPDDIPVGTVVPRLPEWQESVEGRKLYDAARLQALSPPPAPDPSQHPVPFAEAVQKLDPGGSVDPNDWG